VTEAGPSARPPADEEEHARSEASLLRWDAALQRSEAQLRRAGAARQRADAARRRADADRIRADSVRDHLHQTVDELEGIGKADERGHIASRKEAEAYEYERIADDREAEARERERIADQRQAEASECERIADKGGAAREIQRLSEESRRATYNGERLIRSAQSLGDERAKARAHAADLAERMAEEAEEFAAYLEDHATRGDRERNLRSQ
jgi:hypothetical protein